MLGVDPDVQLAQKLDRFEILSAAEAVRNPLSLLSRVVEVEHGRNGVDPQAIRVVRREPVLGGGREKAPDLVPAIVEDVALPVRMESLPGVRVLIQMRSVELAERERVCRKV